MVDLDGIAGTILIETGDFGDLRFSLSPNDGI
jgi:hypothetical protein